MRYICSLGASEIIHIYPAGRRISAYCTGKPVPVACSGFCSRETYLRNAYIVAYVANDGIAVFGDIGYPGVGYFRSFRITVSQGCKTSNFIGILFIIVRNHKLIIIFCTFA